MNGFTVSLWFQHDYSMVTACLQHGYSMGIAWIGYDYSMVTTKVIHGQYFCVKKSYYFPNI